MDTGLLIAIQIVGLYLCLGPFVFLGLYVLFDRLAEEDPAQGKKKKKQQDDPALWNSAQIRAFFDKKASDTMRD